MLSISLLIFVMENLHASSCYGDSYCTKSMGGGGAEAVHPLSPCLLIYSTTSIILPLSFPPSFIILFTFLKQFTYKYRARVAQ